MSTRDAEAVDPEAAVTASLASVFSPGGKLAESKPFVAQGGTFAELGA